MYSLRIALRYNSFQVNISAGGKIIPDFLCGGVSLYPLQLRACQVHNLRLEGTVEVLPSDVLSSTHWFS